MDKQVVNELLELLKEQIQSVDNIDDKIDLLNEIRKEIHSVSPLKHHPVDCVTWEKSEFVETQRINPNSMASPEFELLYQSVKNDGYTMGIVTYRQPDGILRIVDGTHRRKLERTHKDISESTFGRIPTTLIRASQEGETDRFASTVRHNRSRGSHSVDIMSDIVAELVQSGMSDGWIAKHLGFDKDELLRLKQITGLASLFADQEFSEGHVEEMEIEERE